MNILIVDDERIARKGLNKILTEHLREKADIWEASDVETARDLLVNFKPDIVLLDIRMPGEEGFALVEELRMSNPLVRIIIVSGHDDFQYSKTAIQHKVFDYILKPVKKEELISVFNKAIQEQESIKQQHQDTFFQDFDRLTMEEQNNVFRKFPWIVGNELYCMVLLLEDNQRVDQIYSRFKRHLIKVCGDDMYVLARYRENGIFYMAKKKGAVNFNFLKILLSNEKINYFAVDCYSTGTEFINIYRDLKLEARFCLIVGYCNKIYHFDKNKNQPLVSESEYQKLKQVLKQTLIGNESNANGLINMLKQIKAGSFNEWNNLALMIIYSLQMECDRLRVNIDLRYEYEEILRNAANIKTAYNFLHESINKVIRLLREEQFTDGQAAIKRALFYVEDHYNEKITIKDLAAVTHISPNYFCELFKKHTGRSFLDYLTDIRMKKADELLQNSDLKVYEVARRVGYDNERYFSRVYKEYYGKLPSNSRKRRDI